MTPSQITNLRGLLAPRAVDDPRPGLSAAEAFAALSSLLDAAERVERLREGIMAALHCTPSIHHGAGGLNPTIQYDCGDPWELLRALLAETADGGAK